MQTTTVSVQSTMTAARTPVTLPCPPFPAPRDLERIDARPYERRTALAPVSHGERMPNGAARVSLVKRMIREVCACSI